MSIEQNLLNSGGGIIVAGMLYAGASMYVTGPLILERMAEKSGWLAKCEARVESDLKARHAPDTQSPGISCEEIFDGLDPALGRFLKHYGGDAACRVIDAQNAARRRAAELKSLTLDRALSNANAACACALTQVSEEKRGSFALYAGSARLIQPTALRHFEAALDGALAAPQCTALAKAGGAS